VAFNLIAKHLATDALSCGVAAWRIPGESKRRGSANGWRALLKFENGSRVRFLGANLQELRALSKYLAEMRPNHISFSTGPVAAGLLAFEGRIEKDTWQRQYG
jgi:hypothetical protein